MKYDSEMELMEILSIGLVTHEKSQYFKVGSKNNKLDELVGALNVSNKNILISNEDNFSQKNLDINLKKIILETVYYLYVLILIQIKIVRYSQYQTIKTPLLHLAESFFIAFKPLCQYMLGYFFSQYETNFNKQILRQKNISYSHLKILKNLSVHDNNKYILILEDDFQCLHQHEVRDVIKKLLKILDDNEELKIINCSESFSEKQLGIEKINLNKYNLTSSKTKIIQYKFPVTNTACAIIYKQELCKNLILELESLSKYSLIPIDHKINLCLNKLIKQNKIKSFSYASVVPGIFIQRSIHES